MKGSDPGRQNLESSLGHASAQPRLTTSDLGEPGELSHNASGLRNLPAGKVAGSRND